MGGEGPGLNQFSRLGETNLERIYSRRRIFAKKRLLFFLPLRLGDRGRFQNLLLSSLDPGDHTLGLLIAHGGRPALVSNGSLGSRYFLDVPLFSATYVLENKLLDLPLLVFCDRRLSLDRKGFFTTWKIPDLKGYGRIRRSGLSRTVYQLVKGALRLR